MNKYSLKSLSWNNIELQSECTVKLPRILDWSGIVGVENLRKLRIKFYSKESHYKQSGDKENTKRKKMARRFHNRCGRTLIVVLFILPIIHRIDGYPSNRTRAVRQSELPRLPQNLNHPGPVPACRNTTYCVETPYYPSDWVDLILSRNESFKYLATVDVPSKLATRDLEDEEALCTFTEEVVRPKSALSIGDDWRYIVNNEKLTQAVRVEICKSRNSACQIIDGFSDGYTTTCKQTYIYRQLVAVMSGGTIGTELFKVPASCKCFIKLTDPFTRMGILLNKNKKQSPVSKRLRH